MDKKTDLLPPSQPVASNAFPVLFQELEGGDAQHRASELLSELTRAVSVLGKVGKLTITLTAAPVNRGRNVSFTVDMATKIPKAPSEETLFFVDTNKGFTLHKNDPQQKTLEFKEITGGVPEVQEVAAKAVNG